MGKHDDRMTVKEVAALLGVSVSTVHNYIDEGRLEVWQAKKGGVIRITKEQVDLFCTIRRNEVQR